MHRDFQDWVTMLFLELNAYSCSIRITQHTTAVLLHGWQVADPRARSVGDTGAQAASAASAPASPSLDKWVFGHHLQRSLVEGCALTKRGVVGGIRR